MIALPNKTPEGYKVVMTQLRDTDPAKLDHGEMNKLGIMMIDAIHVLEGTQKGYVFLMDMKGFTLGHMLRSSPFLAQKYMYYLQEAMPIRIIKMHCFNIVSFMDKLLSFVKPFMKQSLLDMMIFHEGIDSLLENVPAEILPSDFPGGKEKSIAEWHGNNCLRDFK